MGRNVSIVLVNAEMRLTTRGNIMQIVDPLSSQDDKTRARRALQYALKAGKINKPRTCSACMHVAAL